MGREERAKARRFRAWHESAHAVVAHAQGLGVASMTLDDTRNVLGTAAENARTSIAGPISDWRELRGENEGFEAWALVEHEPDEGDDLELFRFWAWEVADDDTRRTSLARTWIEDARGILERYSAGRASLVAALLERGPLDEPEILAILGPYPEVSPETLAEREAARAKHTPAE